MYACVCTQVCVCVCVCVCMRACVRLALHSNGMQMTSSMADKHPEAADRAIIMTEAERESNRWREREGAREKEIEGE